MMTPAQLCRVMTLCPFERALLFAGPISDAMTEFAIDSTLARQAAFIAQIAHESGELQYVAELASGAAYECRADLGNCFTGDGIKFKGRGLLQITGRSNYADCSLALFGNALRLLNDPRLLETPQYAADSAGWFWSSRGLNAYADAGDFETISVKINGRNKATGMPNGYSQRMMYWRRAQSALAGS